MNTDDEISVLEVRNALDKFLKSRGIYSTVSLLTNDLEGRVDHYLYSVRSVKLKSFDGRVFTPRVREDDWRLLRKYENT